MPTAPPNLPTTTTKPPPDWLRGDRLFEDADGAPGPLARTAMGLFRPLMPLTLADTPWGWQIVAVARKKG